MNVGEAELRELSVDELAALKSAGEQWQGPSTFKVA